jgi:hypothetical protein
MTPSRSNDDVVFDYRTLRLVIGALAFAFPTVVVALTGKVTTSISASYHEVETRDVFVGFLFIMGALLISYKGHLQGEPRQATQSVWSWFRSLQWVRVYQEDIISTVGGLAAIFTALYPTARDGDPMETEAIVHTIGAFILFGNVAYFCLIAFLRSLNNKLLSYAAFQEDEEFLAQLDTLRSAKRRTHINFLLRIWNFLTLEMQTFQAIAKKQIGRYDREKKAVRVWKLLRVHGRKFTRGYIYAVCGSLILLTLTIFLLLMVFLPGWVTGKVTTFVVETVALGFFGVAWITASKMEYISQIEEWVKARLKKTEAAAQPGAA